MKRLFYFWVLFIILVVITAGCETVHWDKAWPVNTIKAYEEFLQKHPEGIFADEARSRIKKLHFKKG